MKINDPMNYTQAELYEFMHEQGKKRFGSECKHEQVKNGTCVNCLRKVINKVKGITTIFILCLFLFSCTKPEPDTTLTGTAKVYILDGYKTISLPILTGYPCMTVTGTVSPFTNTYMFYRYISDSLVIMSRDNVTPQFSFKVCRAVSEIDSVRIRIGGCVIINEVQYTITY